VYHKLPQDFVKQQRLAVQSLSELEARRETDVGDGEDDQAGDSGVVDNAAGSPEGPRESEPTAMDLLGGLEDHHVCFLLSPSARCLKVPCQIHT
jgi:hypothetical protein